MLFTTAAWSQTTYDIEQAREHAEEILRLLSPNDPVQDIAVEYVGNGRFEISWQPFTSDTSDLKFRSPEIHKERWLTVNEFIAMHGNPVITEAGGHPIQVSRENPENYSWEFQLWTPQGESNIVTIPAREEPQEPEIELLTLLDNKQADGSFTGDYYNVNGIIDWNGKTRLYYQNRANRETGFIESEDLKQWSNKHVREVPFAMSMVQAEDKIYCYTSEGDTAYLWDRFNPDKGCERNLGAIYEWRIDGTLPPSYIDGEFVQLGRVRGTGPQSQGGWGNDDTDYPVAEDYPQIVEAFEPYPYWEAEDYIQDRRGLSIHRSENGENWSSRILADPENIDLPGFRGWKNREANGIADFYSGVVVHKVNGKELAFAKVYWKAKDRLVDRKIMDNVRRRFRFTGETTFIPAIIENGGFKIISTESVVPKEFHARRVTVDMVQGVEREPKLTKPGRLEVGQITPANRIIIRDETVHIWYFYRDDTHYESGWAGQHEGVYQLNMPLGEFYKLYGLD